MQEHLGSCSDDNKLQKSGKKNKKSKTTQAADATAAPLFMIDTKPTPIDAAAITKPEEDEGSKSKKNQPPPSGLNRTTRRRIMLIERQREKIQKKLGAADPRADEVEKELAVWTARYDQKAEAKLEKVRVRKAKEAARLKSKTGKALTGRRLKEREKLVASAEKAALKREGKKGSRS